MSGRARPRVMEAGRGDRRTTLDSQRNPPRSCYAVRSYTNLTVRQSEAGKAAKILTGGSLWSDAINMQQQMPGLYDAPPPDRKSAYALEFDGSCEPNPGLMQIGFVIRDPAGKPVAEDSRKLGYGTNNIAEYQALTHGLRAALRLGIDSLRVQGDSKIVIDAVNGRGMPIRKRHPNMRPLLMEAWTLREKFREIEFRHVRREFNTHADRLSTMR